MNLRRTRVASMALLAATSGSVGLLVAAAPAHASGNGIATRSYQQTNLVSNIPGLALHTDPNLRNSWGTSTGPGLPIWVSDNAAGVATLYDGQGNPQPAGNQLVVSIPAPPSAGPGAVGAPDGTVFNPTTGFVVSNGTSSGPAKFLFATEDGTIVGWNPAVDGTHAIIAVDRSTATDSAGDVGAVYKGLALITTPTGTNIYASNFRFGVVEEYNSNFQLVSSFTDPTIPAGFAPFGVHNVGGNLFVTYAKQGPGKFDDDAGPGHGFVDEFSPSGALLARVASEGRLDSPWAVTQAPSSFGTFAGDILVGNFGNGRINAFDPTTHEFLGQLRDHGGPLTIQGLWGLRFPTGSLNVTPGALYFTAGPDHEANGLFGDIVPSP
jgi:uncharacterized protein (TIGR03118 family)